MTRRLSPSQIDLNRILAAKASRDATLSSGIAPTRPASGPIASAYGLLRQQLGEHLAEIKLIKGTSKKIARKRELLPEYDDHLNAVLDAAEAEGKALQDEVFAYLTLWYIDCASVDWTLYDRAFDLVDHVMTYGLDSPEAFRRDMGNLLLENVCDPALTAIALATPDEAEPFPIALLTEIETLTAKADHIDEVLSKLNKALGLLYLRKAQKIESGETDGPAGGLQAARSEALKRLRTALELNQSCGVKQDFDKLKKAIAKAAIIQTDTPPDHEA